MKLLAPSELKKRGVVLKLIGFEKLNEPEEYIDYVHFSAFPGCNGEVIVLSHQEGHMITDFNAQYQPGARIYIDNYSIIQNSLIVRDGLHCTKVKGELDLNRFMMDIVTEADCLEYRKEGNWTPQTFCDAANSVFRNRNGDDSRPGHCV